MFSFWLVADLVIPDGLQKNDWWLVKVSDKQKETVEGFRIEGSLKRIVYAASSPKVIRTGLRTICRSDLG